MKANRQRLEERRDLALRDLIDLDEQLQAGEVDRHRAQELRASYEAEAVAALDALDALADEPDEKASAAPRSRRRTWRLLASATVIVGIVGGALWALPGAVSDRPDRGFVTGNEATGGRDLDAVSNEEMEAVVADNPDVVSMRLRLAHRYLDEGDFGRAFDHYTAVLDRREDPEALSHLGWVMFNQGEADLGEQLAEASLARQPGDTEALWFLANIRLLGTSDPAGALAALDELDRGDLRPQDREAFDELRRAARERLDDREESS